jgi:hypothetical protein
VQTAVQEYGNDRLDQLLQLLGDTSGDVMALTTDAFVSVNLGRNQESVEAALPSVCLSQYLEKDEHSVWSCNALGVANRGPDRRMQPSLRRQGAGFRLRPNSANRRSQWRSAAALS